eukprot:TRINITY_DN7654_c0_g1_i1.p1 TRINITY_DN7654_c0_g1~~TRINITY_DN7654_c0_g1_i1.p1  ORF type:complete len:969 (+),score=470.10 TRINITY_DN7654_c0_g1_i1:46-2907(+)
MDPLSRASLRSDRRAVGLAAVGSPLTPRTHVRSSPAPRPHASSSLASYVSPYRSVGRFRTDGYSPARPAPGLREATPPRGSPAARHDSSRLEEELERSRQTIARLEDDASRRSRQEMTLLTDAEDRKQQQLSEQRAALEVEAERARTSAAELRVYKDRAANLEARVRELELQAQKAAGMEAKAEQLRRTADDKTAALAALGRRRDELEEKLLKLQGSSNERVLEGKLQGLQGILSETRQQVERERDEKRAQQRIADDLRREFSESQRRGDDLERQLGQHEAESESRRAEVVRLQARLQESADAAVQSQAPRRGWTAGAVAELHEKDQALAEAREQVRERGKRIASLEHQLQVAEAATREQEAAAAASTASRSKAEQEAEQEREAARTNNAERQKLAADLSAQVAVCEGVRAELAREAGRVRQLTADLQQQESVRQELIGNLHDANTNLSIKAALEEQLHVLEGSLTRSDQDLAAETQRHQASKRRVRELEDKLRDMQWLRESAADLEADVAARQQTIEQLLKQQQTHNAAVAEMRDDAAKDQSRLRAAREEARQVGSERDALEQRLAEAEREALRCGALEGRLSGMESLLEQRQQELKEASERAAGAMLLEKRVVQLEQELEQARSQQSATSSRVQQLDGEVRRARAAATEAQQEGEREAAAAKAARIDAKAESQRVRDVAEELADAKAQLAHKALAEQQLAEAQTKLAQVSDEVRAERGRADAAESATRLAQDDVDALRRRADDLEKQLGAETDRLQQAQQDIGAKTVQTESLQGEVARLQKDSEWRRSQQESGADQIARPRRRRRSRRGRGRPPPPRPRGSTRRRSLRGSATWRRSWPTRKRSSRTRRWRSSSWRRRRRSWRRSATRSVQSGAALTPLRAPRGWPRTTWMRCGAARTTSRSSLGRRLTGCSRRSRTSAPRPSRQSRCRERWPGCRRTASGGAASRSPAPTR